MEEVILYGEQDQFLNNQKGLEIVEPLILGSLRIHHGESTGNQVSTNKQIRQSQRNKNPSALHSHLHPHKICAHQTQVWNW